ncbi:hypothetical protein E2C01_006474 [Portunus trituberculatus]|uniref:Uncharacterized protein n=1 Tax=Portunus trituberculatus TaxID=210409 RepID=A0A5B7CWF7_PORTR|nr:hypothetical protein [Portunus trituberculatus]
MNTPSRRASYCRAALAGLAYPRLYETHRIIYYKAQRDTDNTIDNTFFTLGNQSATRSTSHYAERAISQSVSQPVSQLDTCPLTQPATQLHSKPASQLLVHPHSQPASQPSMHPPVPPGSARQSHPLHDPRLRV